MKVDDPIGIVHHLEAASPEAQKAQRMAELADIAEYRARHLAAYSAWSKPDAIRERQECHRQEAQAARDRAQRMINVALDQELEDLPEKVLPFKMTPIVKPKPRSRLRLIIQHIVDAIRPASHSRRDR